MRLVTFNILHGRSPGDDRVDLRRLATAIRDLDPDILALQEVDRLQERSQLADLTVVAAEAMRAVSHRFAAALAGTPGATWMAATGSELPDAAAYGIALLARYPATSWQVLRLPRIPGRFPLYLRGPGKMIMVNEEPRAAVVGSFRTPIGALAVANTHLTFVPGWRRRQLGLIRRDLGPLPDPVVLMGDLNMRPPAPARITGFRPLAERATFPVATPSEQLDHILVRGHLPAVVRSAAVALPVSDHRALLVDIVDSDG
jgi:endonuclease/exonuclease/phosphatase family metal-dependent hydrolase